MKKKLLGILLFLFTIITTSIPLKIYAINTPTLNAYQLNNHVKLEWATEMDEKDVLNKTSFEDGEELPNFYWQGVGNQSISTATGYNSSRSVKLTNTQNNTGNYYSYPQTNSIYSAFFLTGKRVPNNTYLSVNFKAKSVSGRNSTILFSSDSPWADRGLPIYDDNSRLIKYGQTVNFNSPPDSFSAYTDGGTISLADGRLFVIVSSKGTNHDFGVMYYRWNNTQKRFIREAVTEPFTSQDAFGNAYINRKDIFYAGDSVLYLTNVYTIFNNRTIPSTGEWINVSANALVNSNIYNFYNQGFKPSFIWSTDGELYIDAIKLGYATNVNIYKNGNITPVYTGYLSDYEDLDATDKAVPNPVSGLNITMSNNIPQILWNASTDNGSNYNYTIQGTSNSGTSAMSSNYPVNIASGIKGYSIIIDNNPNTVVNSNNITTTMTNYTAIAQTQNFYVHVASVDNSGNVSSTTTYFKDITKPTIASYYVDNITGDGYDVYVTGVSDDYSGVNRVQFPTWTDYKSQDDIDTNWGNSATSKGTNLGNGNWKFHVNRSEHNNEYGSYTTHIYVYDNSGNYNCVGGVQVVLDVTPPSLVVSEDTTNWTNKNVTLTATATDTQSGVKRIQLPDGNWVNNDTISYVVNSNGTYNFVAEDVRGNQTIKSITVNNIDKTTPTGTITQNPTSWTNSNVTLTVAGYDSESGVKSITKPDGTVINGNSTTYIANTNGTYDFVVTDNVGNTFSKSYTVNNIDKVLPTLNLTLDSDLITNKTVTINANASDGESGIQSITKPDGTIVNGSSTSYTVDKNGVYSFKATDVAGNIVTVSITVNNIIAINTISGIDHIEYKLEGATTQDWTTYNSLAIVNEGITTIYARAVDKAGNYSDVATSVVKLDRSLPINTTIKIVAS